LIVRKGTIFMVVALTGAIASAQTVNLRGKVSNQAGRALANATVTLAPQGLTAMSGTDGSYSIVSSSISRVLPADNKEISVRNDVLEISLSKDAPVDVEIFDTKGSRLKSDFEQNVPGGVYRLDLGKISQGTKVLVIKTSVGDEVSTFHYVQMGGSNSAGSATGSITQVGGMSARMAASMDTLKVTASGYTSFSMPLSSLDTTINITLDTGDRWGGLKNAPIKSAGCGKALGTISASGTYHISSAGGRGDYIINIPSGYNKDTPYRLVFGNHCLGGSAAAVAAPDKGDDLSGFYSIKTLADADNSPGIYIALQGNSDGTWNPPNDLTFWNDVLTLVENNMCVDTTRVFVVGFSFGAMFTYTLSLEYPEKIRAVACYAPANYNMTQPTNRHIPIAYYQTTGTNDGTCPWINNDAQKTGGKYCLLQHMQDNGCTSTAADIKLATGNTHVVNEFAGCKDGYPVKFSSFVGGHQATDSDAGSTANWIQNETWAFLKQF
jgi:poly(3-hydroxybutyrate) depolymerase